MPTFNVQPGIVSAVYFITFDIFLLALLDIVLARIVNSIYYRQVNVGQAIPIQSVDIPGVTTFLIGRIFSFPNLIALGVKLGFLACILLIDLKIDSEVREATETVNTTGTFNFDPSDEEFNAARSHSVERTWARQRNCRITDATTSSIKFYALSFDLKNKSVVSEITSDPILKYSLIERSTILCLSPNIVRNPVSLVNVIGCSQQLGPTICFNRTRLRRKGTLDFGDVDSVFGASQLSAAEFDIIKKDQAFISSIWPEYTNATLLCSTTFIGVAQTLPTNSSAGRPKRFTSCLINDNKPNITILEHWDYNATSNTFTRFYPGPVFDRNINLGQTQSLVFLENMASYNNWETIASTIVADSTVFKLTRRTITLIRPTTQTVVPAYAIGIGIGMVLIAFTSRIVVAFTIGKDERPQLNSINGLSSIAREEHEPTGCSYVGGRGMLLGLSSRNTRANVVHLGPLRSLNDGVARDRDVRIE